MFQSLGPTELLIIFAIVLLLFGAGRVGKVGHELGSAISEFRKGLKEGDDETPAEEDAANKAE